MTRGHGVSVRRRSALRCDVEGYLDCPVVVCLARGRDGPVGGLSGGLSTTPDLSQEGSQQAPLEPIIGLSRVGQETPQAMPYEYLWVLDRPLGPLPRSDFGRLPNDPNMKTTKCDCEVHLWFAFASLPLCCQARFSPKTPRAPLDWHVSKVSCWR